MAGRKSSKLLGVSSVELKKDFDEAMERSWHYLHDRLQKFSSKKEVHDYLVSVTSISAEKYTEISQALLFAILTSKREKAAEYFRDLSFVTSGVLAWNSTLSNVNFMVVEWFPKLFDGPREQLIWFIGEAVKNNIPNIDDVCTRALRNINGGDLSNQNIRLADSMLTILSENIEWMRGLSAKSSLIPHAVYTYLRLICDHQAAVFDGLRQKEVRFCIWLLRERLMECVTIGRDLIRLLVMLGRIPEIDKLWMDILHRPTLLSPQFRGLVSLLEMKSNKKFLSHRLPTVMERELSFLLSSVRLGQHERHLQWFQAKYLSKPESASLRCDTIRFVCTCFPSNVPDMFPRWAVLNFLLPNTLSPTDAQFCKLSIFWDWLFFEPHSSDIRGIECVYGLMFNTVKNIPTVTTTLLDFLCRSMTEFLPQHQKKIRSSVVAGFRALVDQNIVISVSPVLESSRITDGRLRLKLKETFSELMRPPPSTTPPPLQVDPDESGSSLHGAFSDEEEQDVEDATTRSQSKSMKEVKKPSRIPKTEPKADTEEEKSFEMSLPVLDDRLKTLLLAMRQPLKTEEMCYKLQQLLVTFLQDDELHEDNQMEGLAECLCALFKEELDVQTQLLPENFNDESAIEESLSSPVFMILRNACLSPDGDDTRETLIRLLGEMYLVQNKIGYYLLYLLKAGKELEERNTPYTSLCEILDSKIGDSLVKDLDLCQNDDVNLFGYLIPFVFQTFSNDAMNSSALMRLIVGTIDGRQLNTLVGELIQETFRMFKKDSFSEIMRASLEWSTIEQTFLWELVAADSVPIDWVLPLIPKLEEKKHDEAVTSILLMVKRMDKEPNSALLKAILSRDPTKPTDQLSTLALKILIDDWPEKMVEKLSSHLGKLSMEYNNRAKRPKGLTLENLLGHLDRLRMDCPKLLTSEVDSFFGKPELQIALGKARNSVSESLKLKYSELFAMMEILESLGEAGRSLRRGRTARAGLGKGKPDDDSSEEESKSRSKTKKRKIEYDSD